MSDANWRGLMAVFLSIVAGVFIWSTMEPSFCQAAAGKAENVLGCWEFWFNRYQTLIAGTFAIVAAWIALGIARAQMSHAEKMEKDRREAEHYAARATLALALDEITEYAERVLAVLKPGLLVPTRFTDRKDLPDPPSGIVQPLRDCVRFAGETERKQIADLLATLQVQQARLRGSKLTPVERLDCAVDAARLYAQAEALFGYARRSEEGSLPRPSADDVRRVLRLLRFDSDEFESLHKWVR